MVIRAWWENDSAERYWMEATDRPDIGEDLRAPQQGNQGQNVWHYDLVSLTQPGDIVFHWHKRLFEHPALVGWSEVTGPLTVRDHAWTPRAGSGRSMGAQTRPNWVMPLGGIHFFDRPIFIAELTEIREEMLGIERELSAQVGEPTYYPFNTYGDNHLRAAQAYFTKVPSALVHLLDERFGLELDALAVAGGDGEPVRVPVRPGTGQGFASDTERRLAVEKHAVSMAVQMYEALGADDIEVLGKPYDLRLRLAGREVHVEVKGSVNAADAVFVTRNEVEHARAYPHVELVVVDEIAWVADQIGGMRADGGKLRRWKEWEPADHSLTAMTYSHSLDKGFE